MLRMALKNLGPCKGFQAWLSGGDLSALEAKLLGALNVHLKISIHHKV